MSCLSKTKSITQNQDWWLNNLVRIKLGTENISAPDCDASLRSAGQKAAVKGLV